MSRDERPPVFTVVKEIIDKLPKCSLANTDIPFKGTVYGQENPWDTLKELNDDITVLEYIFDRLYDYTFNCCIEEDDCKILIDFFGERLNVMEDLQERLERERE